MQFDSLETIDLDIKNKLQPYINSDYVLFDIPNHRNIGDQLIYQGELDFLKQLPFKCLDKSSVSFHFNPKVDADTILLHGGGNFGDLYPYHQQFREKIVSDYPDKRIVLFPNSVQFESHENLLKSAQLFNNHPSIVLCARDLTSYELLKEHFNKCTILLVCDMAFCSNYVRTQIATKELGIIVRRDFELKNEQISNKTIAYDEIDWPTFDKNWKEKFHLYFYSINRIFSEFIYAKRKKNSVFGIVVLRDEKKYIQLGINLLSKYKFIISTRLHGHILSLLLGIPSIIVDNSYGKNKRFYDTWLKNISNSYYANSVEEAIEIYKELQKKNIHSSDEN